MNDKTSFGHYLASRRRFLRMTQEELANRMGVSKSAVAKWETDGGLPDRENLGKLAESIHIPVEDLHKVIRHGDVENAGIKVDITEDVISTLESYGYKVIRPGEDGNTDLEKK